MGQRIGGTKARFREWVAPPNGSPLFLITGFTSSSRVRAGNFPQRRVLYHRFFRTRFRGILCAGTPGSCGSIRRCRLNSGDHGLRGNSGARIGRPRHSRIPRMAAGEWMAAMTHSPLDKISCEAECGRCHGSYQGSVISSGPGPRGRSGGSGKEKQAEKETNRGADPFTAGAGQAHHGRPRMVKKLRRAASG
jgi:hypothetical protein